MKISMNLDVSHIYLAGQHGYRGKEYLKSQSRKQHPLGREVQTFPSQTTHLP